MIRAATREDLTPLRELFRRANDSPYDLAAVAEEKCFGDGFAGPPTTRVFEQNGQILGAAVTCGKWLRILAVDRDARRQGIGTALLGNDLEKARRLGTEIVQIVVRKPVHVVELAGLIRMYLGARRAELDTATSSPRLVVEHERRSR